MTGIHPTAVVAPGAQLGADVEVGPYCVIGAGVRVGARTRLHAHVCLEGRTTLGEDCEVFPFATIGARTQDLKYRGAQTAVRIGNRTTVRECATINAGTNEGEETAVGDDCLLMAYSHVAHACRVGNQVVIANCGTLAGDVLVEDQAIIGGLAGVHQFVRVGRLAIIGGCSKVTRDCPPYMMVDGNPARVRGLNRVGLQRRGVAAEACRRLKRAHRILFREGLSIRNALQKVETEVESCAEVAGLLAFVRASQRGLAV